MQRVKCSNCGRVYDRDMDNICPDCGSNMYRLPKNTKGSNNGQNTMTNGQNTMPNGQNTMTNGQNQMYNNGQNMEHNSGMNNALGAEKPQSMMNTNTNSGDLKTEVINWIKLYAICMVPILNIVVIFMNWNKISTVRKAWIIAGLIWTVGVAIIMVLANLMCCGLISASLG